MWELRDCEEVPKAFQINIKLTFLGTNPTREQIHAWWEAENEARLSLLSAAIKTNRELIKRVDEKSVQVNTEIAQEMLVFVLRLNVIWVVPCILCVLDI